MARIAVVAHLHLASAESLNWGWKIGVAHAISAPMIRFRIGATKSYIILSTEQEYFGRLWV